MMRATASTAARSAITAGGVLDVSYCRSQFPAFQEPALQGQIHAENAGGTYACEQVIHRLGHFYRELKVQPYYKFDASVQGGRKMDESYASMARYLNVHQDDLSFGPSTSCNTYVLAHALRAGLISGDEIIVTNQDHETNTGVWRRIATEMGAIVREWRVNPSNGMLCLDDLEQLLSSKTRLVAFPHCSNIVAHVNPVAEIAAKAHEASCGKALVVCDGVSYCGHGLPNCSLLGADIYMFSTYKTFGPHQGVMVVRERARNVLANQGHYFNASYPQKRYTPSGPDHAQIAACHGISQYFDTLIEHHFGDSNDPQQHQRDLQTLIHKHEACLMAPLLSFLCERQDRGHLRLLGPRTGSKRTPTIAFQLLLGAPRANHVAELAQGLAERGVGVGFGSFYSDRLLEALNIALNPGVVRISLVHYNTLDEVEWILSHLEDLL